MAEGQQASRSPTKFALANRCPTPAASTPGSARDSSDLEEGQCHEEDTQERVRVRRRGGKKQRERREKWERRQIELLVETLEQGVRPRFQQPLKTSTALCQPKNEVWQLPPLVWRSTQADLPQGISHRTSLALLHQHGGHYTGPQASSTSCATMPVAWQTPVYQSSIPRGGILVERAGVLKLKRPRAGVKVQQRRSRARQRDAAELRKAHEEASAGGATPEEEHKMIRARTAAVGTALGDAIRLFAHGSVDTRVPAEERLKMQQAFEAMADLWIAGIVDVDR